MQELLRAFLYGVQLTEGEFPAVDAAVMRRMKKRALLQHPRLFHEALIRVLPDNLRLDLRFIYHGFALHTPNDKVVEHTSRSCTLLLDVRV